MRRRLIGLSAGAALLAVAAGCREKPHAWARPLRDVSFEKTEARRERGRYLAEGVLQCFACHSDRDVSKPGAPPVEGRKGAGHVWRDDGTYRLVAPNLTPDVETGSGRWTDDMLARAIREGVGHDGRPLHPQMWYMAFRYLADEDLASVVVYLRSIPAVRNALPQTRLKAEEATEVTKNLWPLADPVPPPELSTAVERGRYLARVADCSGCHTAWEAPLNPGRYGGGNLIETMATGAPLKAFSRNLTQDPSGIPYFDDALFLEAIRTGNVRGRALSPLMPWVVFAKMTDGDLRAIAAYLATVPRVRHLVDAAEPVGRCALCGQEHGGGALNRPKESRAIPVDPAATAGCEGTYRFPDGYTLVFARKGETLFAVTDGRRDELFTEDNRRFFSKRDAFLAEFVFGPDGRVTHFLDRAFDDDRAERVK